MGKAQNMKWHSFRAGLIEFSLAWDILGLSSRSVEAFCRTPPLGFEPIHRFDDVLGDRRYAQWEHHALASWPGDYVTLRCRQITGKSSFHVHMTATPNNQVYPHGLDYLAQLLQLPHTGINNISLCFNGDGYSAMTRGVAEDHLHQLLNHGAVEMDAAMDQPWEHVVLELAMENQAERLFLRRL